MPPPPSTSSGTASAFAHRAAEWSGSHPSSVRAATSAPFPRRYPIVVPNVDQRSVLSQEVPERHDIAALGSLEND